MSSTVTIPAFVADLHENSPKPGKTVRRLRIGLIPLEKDQKSTILDEGGSFAFELNNPLPSLLPAGLKPGQKVNITITAVD